VDKMVVVLGETRRSGTGTDWEDMVSGKEGAAAAGALSSLAWMFPRLTTSPRSSCAFRLT